MKLKSRHAQYVFIVLLLVGGISGLQITRLQSVLNPQAESLPRKAEVQEQTTEAKLSLLRVMPDLGFRNLVADWTFLNFLQYFGNGDYRKVTGYGLSGDFFDVIIDRDPYSYLPYLYLSSSVSLFAGQPERAVTLQEKGLEQLSPTIPPESYFIWRHKGTDEILYLKDYEAAARSHEIAADWAERSPHPGAEQDAVTLRRTAQFLQSQADATQVQVSAWVQVLSYAPDEKTRAVAIQNIEELGYEVVPNDQGGYSIEPKQNDS